MSDIKKAWKFWRPLVTDKKGRLKKKQIKKELADFYLLLEEVPKVYMAVTGGKLSYPDYDAQTVISVFEDHVSELVDEEIERRQEEKDVEAQTVGRGPFCWVCQHPEAWHSEEACRPPKEVLLPGVTADALRCATDCPGFSRRPDGASWEERAIASPIEDIQEMVARIQGTGCEPMLRNVKFAPGSPDPLGSDYKVPLEGTTSIPSGKREVSGSINAAASFGPAAMPHTPCALCEHPLHFHIQPEDPDDVQPDEGCWVPSPNHGPEERCEVRCTAFRMKLEIHSATAWTHLTAAAPKGFDQLDVEHAAHFRAGDKIVLESATHEHAEEAVVWGVRDGAVKRLHLKSGLAWSYRPGDTVFNRGVKEKEGEGE